jgi:hypothetical protein
MAIIFAVFCLLGLFFLLVKEEITTGYVDVSVRTGPLHHTTQIPVGHASQVQQIRAQVQRAQTLAVRASG